MTAQLIRLDDARPKVREWLRCLFCGLRHYSEHIRDNRPRIYFDCPGCDERASLPEWRVEA